jgi:hypothetical protein
MTGFLSQKTSLALAVQADAVTPATITTPTDLIPMANLTSNNEVFSSANPEYTGTIHAVGDAIFGRAPSINFDVMLRGPGGSAPPTAGAYVPGRYLRACGFDEIVVAGETSAALGAGGVNTGATTTVELAAGASSTDDFYNGMVIQFAGVSGGSGIKSCSTIIDYDGTTKIATLGEKLASVPTGNYTIPPQLVYRLNATANPLWLTFPRWHDRKRYNASNGIPSQLQMTFPTANRGDVGLPIMSCGLTGDIDEATAEVDENSPLTPSAGGIPPVRDGKLALNGVYVPGGSVSYDHGTQVGFPPNPNKPSGNDAGQIVRTQRSISMNLNEVLLTVQNRNALANVQTPVPLMLHYGNVAGRSVSFVISSMRLSFSNPDPSGEFVTTEVSGLIDEADKSVSIAFPFFT